MPTTIANLAEYTTVSTGSFVPIVDVNENAFSKNKKISIDSLRKYFYRNQNLSQSFTEHTPGFYYFGDNSDGPGIFTGSITTLRTRISGSFKSTQDGQAVIKNFSSLFISRSVVIKPTNRCRGLLIFVDGDATISGSLSMSGRGAKFTGSDASFQVLNPPYLGDYWSSLLFPSSSYLSRVFATGAAGAPSAAINQNGQPGSAGALSGQSGGGGGGGGGTTTPSNLGGAGAAGTSFSGGSAGSGAAAPSAGVSGRAFGGAGGSVVAAPATSGGGAGNPTGTLNTNAGEGTGGLLILIVKGNLKIGPNGSITADGQRGGDGFAGGGGSGGGIIYIYYGGNLTNNGSITCNGGAGGTKTGPTTGAGGSGGAGTFVLSKLNTAFPVAN